MGLFEEQRDALMRGYADVMHCEPADFQSERLTIVDRPEDVPWYSLMALTFGVGTVVSVEPRMRAFVEEHAPKQHYRAFSPTLLQAVVNEFTTADAPLAVYQPGICWAIASTPGPEPTPAGFTLQLVDDKWMNAEMTRSRWENGLGTVGANGREFRNQYAVVLSDETCTPAAIAGVFLTYAAHEIGVDVARAHRGNGLAPFVVRAAAREILSRGQLPLYGCAATNIRSQRTALASGFLPVFSDAAVGLG